MKIHSDFLRASVVIVSVARRQLLFLCCVVFAENEIKFDSLSGNFSLRRGIHISGCINDIVDRAILYSIFSLSLNRERGTRMFHKVGANRRANARGNSMVGALLYVC